MELEDLEDLDFSVLKSFKDLLPDDQNVSEPHLGAPPDFPGLNTGPHFNMDNLLDTFKGLHKESSMDQTNAHPE